MKFEKIERLDIRSKNKLFAGHKEGSKFFIKEYIYRKGREKEDFSKMKTEILCYKNISSLKLPKVIKIDKKHKRLILEFVEFLRKPKEINRTLIDEILKLYTSKVLKIDPSFTTSRNYHYYHNILIPHMKTLHKLGLIKNLEETKKRFEQNRKLINKSTNYFSHGDLTTYNSAFMDGELTLFDFEHAGKDNRMYDLATLYIEIYHRTALRAYLLTKIKKLKFFNKELFDLMLFRRGIEVAYGLKHKPNHQHVKNAKEFLT